MSHLVTVLGATGHVGGEAARRLLAGGHRVRAVGRDAARLQPLAARGAETAAGSATDVAFLAEAFRGAEAAFVMVPPDYGAADIRAHQRAVAEAVARTLAGSSVRKVVTLSSVGAHLPSGTGPIAGLHHMEGILGTVPALDVVHLRAAFFLENHLGSIGLIRSQGINGGAIEPDLPIAMIATRDIGAVAADLLASGAFSGASARELLGARDVSHAEATRVLGKAIGRPDLPYVQFPYDGALQAFLGAGISPSVAESFVEMARAFNEGRLRPVEERSAANTTPTTIEEFAATVFVPAYGAG
ncbi:FMN-dependent NADH-azoreductase [Acidobacteria bacterium ACD]|nr:MAG: FMN-dependent NADH-azoreductase [Acidobacteriota bacterium]MDL1950322.1 FMN-dependent NADH-azoreductase [Acidobacteria bacterium ACD]